MGGKGVRQGFSGSGGRIVILNYNESRKQVRDFATRIRVEGGDIINGKDKLACSYGAAGTIYVNHTDLLFIQNKVREGLAGNRKLTPLTNHVNEDYVAQFTFVWDMASITFLNDEYSPQLVFKNLEMASSSQFVEPSLNVFSSKSYRVLGISINIKSNSTFITGRNTDSTVIDLEGTLSLSVDSRIIYQRQIEIYTVGKMIINGKLLMLDNRMTNDEKYQVILYSGDFMLLSKQVEIFCYECVFISENNINFYGKIINERGS